MTMLAAWVVYALVVSALIALGAWWAEESLRSVGRSGRWVWVLAMLSSVLIPVWAWLRPIVYPSPEAAPAAGFIPLAPIVVGPAEMQSSGISLDVYVAAGWAVLTAVAVFRLVRAYLHLQSMRREWRRTMVWGESVYVTRDLGPAVFGLRRGAILMPEWALELEGRIQHLMLLHEREHLRAGDVKLVAMGHLLVLSQPWNLALLWQWRRLREAVEVDCDGRVLQRDPDARSYGALLLEVGRRRAMPQLALAFAEPRTFLERRIDLLTRARQGGRHALGVGALSVLAFGVAICTRDPLAMQYQPLAMVMEAPTEFWETEPVFTPFTTPPRLTNQAAVNRELARNYPPLLRDAGIGGQTLLWFFIDETGRIRLTQINESSGYPGLDEAAARVAAAMEFAPALNRTRPVSVWVQIPIKFSPGPQPRTQTRRASNVVESSGPSSSVTQAIAEAAASVDGARTQTAPDGPPSIEAKLRELSARFQRSEPRVSTGTVRTAVARVNEVAGNTGNNGARMRVPATRNDEAEASSAEFTEEPRLLNEAEIGRLLDRSYPPLLKNAGVGGQVMLWFHIDAQGRVARAVLQRSSHYPALDGAAIRIAESMRFAPARNGDDPVSVWVQIPITFGAR
jgi:TonB family protein